MEMDQDSDMLNSTLPNIWGPHYWYTMKNVAITSDLTNESSLVAVKNFYESLIWLLPCKMCRDHYSCVYTKFDINKHLESNATLINWVNVVQLEIDKLPIVEPKVILRKTQRKGAKGAITRSRKRQLKTELSQQKQRTEAFKQSRQLKNSIESQSDSKCCHTINI
jgi:hypothetical protein